ncbi:hypothetical protein [Palpita vitrealis nucleopolyhedrovirus]|uniref:Uncharacterized protein n=1 Tax=Palpita vitrealis nucleopolyhedrovirus TaxID=2951960 RepID=A0AAE9LNL6_9ABAC|nr:hypothetical protein [Palpita vitrealis nucleopolyhedrovirus]
MHKQIYFNQILHCCKRRSCSLYLRLFFIPGGWLKIVVESFFNGSRKEFVAMVIVDPISSNVKTTISFMVPTSVLFDGIKFLIVLC